MTDTPRFTNAQKAAMLMLRHEEAYLDELDRQGISLKWEAPKRRVKRDGPERRANPV